MPNTPYMHLAAYQFLSLQADTLTHLAETLREKAGKAALKGTILLSPEGINLFLAGTPAAVDAFSQLLRQVPEFKALWLKTSPTPCLPFKTLKVKIKPEIITFKQPQIQPEKQTAPYLEPETFKQWYADKKPMIVLDTRNTYEMAAGAFKDAISLDITQFSDFPQAIQQLPDAYKKIPIVTYCTGGIRCEKAAEYLLQQGFETVWQLKGGILHYFEQCGNDYYQGNCFVFDDRGALTG